jgi:hypothetical protein
MKSVLVGVVAQLYALVAGAQLVAVANINDPFALDSTYDRKCVAYGGRTQCVYATNGTIGYVTSTNGVTWVAGPSIGSGSDPAIAVTSAGQIGVVYRTNTTLEYKYRTVSGWSGATVLEIGAAEAAIAAFGQRVYLAWDWNGVMMTDFVANVPPASVTATRVTNPNTTSTNVYFGRDKISIAVLHQTGISQPLVRVAWFEDQKCNTTSNCTDYFHLVTADGPATSPWPQQLVYNYGPVPTNFSAGTGVSLSMAAEPASGDVYILTAATSAAGTQKTTNLFKQNASNGGAYKNYQFFQKFSLGSVAVAPLGCGSQFRIALTEYPLSNNLGPTWYRTGSWDTASPVWFTSPVALGNGRSPQALFAGGGLSSREVRAVFADPLAIRAATVPSNGLATPNCPKRD